MKLSLPDKKVIFLLNEHGDLSIFLHNFDEIIIFFELKEF